MLYAMFCNNWLYFNVTQLYFGVSWIITYKNIMGDIIDIYFVFTLYFVHPFPIDTVFTVYN